MKAIVLLSGGIDSATTLYYAKDKGHKPFCLSFDYGQRHKKEIYSAKGIAEKADANWRLLKINLPWKKSSLLDKNMRLPKGRTHRYIIPTTYVPARNIIFLSYAVSYAEAIGAKRIFIGANQIDFSGYPDCRLSFIRAINYAAEKGTKSGVEGHKIRIEAPLINKRKSDIIRLAIKLEVPLELTWSCYKGQKKPCLECDSCLIRKKAFREAGLKDPLIYV